MMIMKYCVLAFVCVSCEGFVTPGRQRLASSNQSKLRTSLPTGRRKSLHHPLSSRLHFFNRDKKEEDQDATKDNTDPDDSDKKAFFPFFRKNKELNEVDAKKSSDGSKEENVQSSLATPAPVPDVESMPDDPASRAASLKAQAERMKLEAERMDAELTLQKIGRLERELAVAQRKGNSTDNLVKEMDILQRRMKGESTEVAPILPRTTIENQNAITSPFGLEGESLPPFDKNEFNDILGNFQLLPDSQKVILARSVGLQPISAGDINATEYALRVEKQSRIDSLIINDVSDSSKFTQQEIDDFKRKFDTSVWIEGKSNAPNQSAEIGEEGDALLRKIINEERYFKEMEKVPKVAISMPDGVSTSDKTSQGFSEGFNSIFADPEEISLPARYVENFFPKCVEKEGQNPTEAQIQMLMSDVLPSTGFSADSAPVKVYGGYLIQGDSRKENGDDLVDAIDAAIASSPLSGKVTIAYVPYLPAFLGMDDQEEFEAAFFAEPKALYVMGPDVSRNRQRILLSVVSAFGIASSWYLSIFPFLLNPTLMKKAEEQVGLADASMQYDLSWLTDLSIPLFTTFLGLQFAHEFGHRVVAGTYGLNITFPTFVPSLASGITSSITNLKSPPKNRDQLFDFAIAGPFFGITASLIALYAGLRLTAIADPVAMASFPSFPLELLRQSSLGGGVIEFVLGNGVLNIPEAARGSQAVASINVQLHPIAIAGYISLFVNALGLLPIGGT